MRWSRALARLGAADLCLDPAGCLLEAVSAAPVSLATPKPAVDVASLADERERVEAALERCGHVQAKAARLLGLSERQLSYRIRKYGISVWRF